MACTGVHLGSINMDGTPDSEGIYWAWRTIAGWWEGGAPSMSVVGRPGADGSILGSGFRRNRPVTLEASAWVPPQIAEATAKTLMFSARRKVNVAADLVHSVGTFTVDEEISRYLNVRRNLPLNFLPQTTPRKLDFAIPLISTTWQKFSSTASSASGTSSVSAPNGGNAPAIPVVTLTGPKTGTVSVLRTEIGDGVYTDWTLGSGDVMVIDFATMTMTVNGGDQTSHILPVSLFFGLEPGSNTITSNDGGGSMSVAWHNGWL